MTGGAREIQSLPDEQRWFLQRRRIAVQVSILPGHSRA